MLKKIYIYICIYIFYICTVFDQDSQVCPRMKRQLCRHTSLYSDVCVGKDISNKASLGTTASASVAAVVCILLLFCLFLLGEISLCFLLACVCAQIDYISTTRWI